MPDFDKRAWVTPAIRRFTDADALRRHLQERATVDQIPAIEAMIDRFQSSCSAADHREKFGAMPARRRG